MMYLSKPEKIYSKNQVYKKKRVYRALKVPYPLGCKNLSKKGSKCTFPFQLNQLHKKPNQ